MRLSPVLLALAGTLLVAGCASDPYGNQTQRSSSATGSGLGALAGAAAGALSGDGSTSRRDRALIGAAVGAAAGAGIGAYMDRQEEQLRQRLNTSRVAVERRGNDIVLNMPGEVTFGFDSSRLTQDARLALNEVADVLRSYTDTRVRVAGHTDNTGDSAYNQRLSEQRANAVAAYLNGRGVDMSRLDQIGYGEARPVADNTSAEGRALNRRVEITLSAVSA